MMRRREGSIRPLPLHVTATHPLNGVQSLSCMGALRAQQLQPRLEGWTLHTGWTLELLNPGFMSRFRLA